jgi:hypothetical protein
MHEWVKKKWYVYKMEHYPAIKKSEILPSAATRVELKDIMLSEVNQAQKDKHHMISLTCGSLGKGLGKGRMERGPSVGPAVHLDMRNNFLSRTLMGDNN